MSFGVTQELIESFGETVFDLSLNRQRRTGDPVRELDFAAIEAQRADMGLSDAEISGRIGLTTEQVRFISVVMERRRFRTNQYRKLFRLGGGRRYREERYMDPEEIQSFGEDALRLRQAMGFEAEAVKGFVGAGWWQGETLGDQLTRHATERPDHPAIIVGDEVVSYAELAGRVDGLAGGLLELGLARGDVVAVQLPNLAEFVIAFFAITAIGGVMSTIHMPYRETEIRALLGHNRARAVICLAATPDYQAAATMLDLKPELPSLEHVIVLGEAVAGTLDFAEVANGSLPLGGIENSPVAADPFLLLYTSGTTDAPKGVPLSYQNMLANGRAAAPEHGIGPDDVILSAAPLSHLLGLYCPHLALTVGATMLLLPAFSPPALAATIEAGRATMLLTAPAHVAACLGTGLFEQHDVSSLKLAIMSGTTCPPDLVRTLAAKLGEQAVCQLWGMTELQAGTFTRPGDGLEVASTSAGRACPGNEIRVVGEDGVELGPDQEGELQVRGASIFPGYLDNDTANAEAFTADGWFRSGDLATIDAAGNLSLCGRSKDLIDRGGVKFNPLDIERLLDAHPAIAQSAIAPVPDERLGERACAYVVLAGEESVTLEELAAYLEAQNISKNKWPERLEIIAEMPLTPTRKIIKGKLRPQES